VSRFSYLLLLATLSLAPFPARAQNVAAPTSDSPERPRIFEILYVEILVSNVDQARTFYAQALRAVPPTDSEEPCHWCERTPLSSGVARKLLAPIQVERLKEADSTNLLKEIAFRTDNVKTLRELLLKNHFSPGTVNKCGDDPCFTVLDPENHRLVFIQPSFTPPNSIPGAYAPISTPRRSPIIHAGFVVRDRAAEDRFFKDTLGFHIYWHGGMKDGDTDWVDMQVPDGTAWVEYMLNVNPRAEKRELGVMNHIALGVPDVPAVANQLESSGVKLPEPPQIGRDGKWQLNLYDPDFTRVEIMEFAPVEKPCCSEYTGPHPKP